MQKVFFTVGPTQRHPMLEEFMRDAFANDITSISHRGSEFQSIFRNTIESLKRLLKIPQSFHVFFLGSATEAMERIIENCAEKHTFHLVNGSFSNRFFSTAEDLKKKPKKQEVSPGEGFDFGRLHIPAGTELVCLTQNETSTGVQTSMNEIHALKKRYPNILFALDIVSSAPYVEVDYSLIDCAFFSVQKGFGMPAGLGVLVMNDRCIGKSRELQSEGVNVGTYHSFPTLLKFAQKNQTPETPNVLDIYLLGRICDVYNKYGIERIRKDTEEKAKRLYDFFDAHMSLAPFIPSGAWRSRTTLTIQTPGGSQGVRNKLESAGLLVDRGYGEFKETQIRIANFPVHSAQDVERLLEAVE